VTGGYVTSASGTLGVYAGSSGTATVSSGTWANSGNFVVGSIATGTLNLNGGLVSVGGNLTAGAAGTINLNSGGRLQIGVGSTSGVLLSGTGSLVDNGTLIFNRSDASTYSGSLSGSGAVVKQSGGTLSLSGSSTYTGGTTISAGTLQIGNANALGTGDLAVNAGTLDFKGTSLTTAALSGFSGAIITSSTSGAVTLTASSTANSTFGGAIQDGSGTVAFAKQGAGTLTLSGSNSYSGTTTVSAGELKVNGSTGTGAMTIASAATLSGTGIIHGATTISGTHNPGNSPGIQTFTSDLTYASVALTGPKVFWELAGNTSSNSPLAYDQIVVGQNLVFGSATSLELAFGSSGSTANWANAFWATNEQWTIYQVGGTTSGFSNLLLTSADWLDSQGNLFNSLRAGNTFSLMQIGQNVVLMYTASQFSVPEIDPASCGSALALLIGSLGLLERRRIKAKTT